jgi:hypothetical protein
MAVSQSNVVAAVSARPQIRAVLLPTDKGGLGWTSVELTNALNKQMSSVLQEVSLDYPWDFVIKETSTTSVANQATYTLAGANDDALEIATIKYGDNERLIIKKTQTWIDDWLTRQSVGYAKYWVPYGRDDNDEPKIKFIAATTESGQTILYRYWTKNLKLSLFPSLYSFVFESCLAKRFDPVFRDEYNEDIARAIATHTRSGGETNLTVLDPVIRAANQRRNALHGWTG